MTIQTSQRTVEGGAARDRTGAFAPLRKYIIGGGALVVVLAGFYYWSHGGDAGPRRAPPVPVATAAVQQKNMPVVKNTIGTVMANSVVQLAPRVSGVINAAAFKEGQLVKKGDLLFVIDPRPFQAALSQAQGQLAKDQAALDGARRDLRRFQSLMALNAESQQVVDDELATVSADEGNVAADRGTVQTAQLNLEFTQIRSPVDGKTGPILVQPGNTIVANLATTPLVTIDEIHPIKVSFNLPQSDLPQIQSQADKGTLAVMVRLHNAGGKTLSAPVNFVSNAVGIAGTIELRATFPNLDNVLVPGQLVDVTVALDDIPKAMVVPRVAVINGPDGTYVYRVSAQKTVEQVPVSVAFDDGTDMAVQGDINAGDQVITDGGLRVVPGSKVTFARIVTRPAGGKGAKGKRGGPTAGKG